MKAVGFLKATSFLLIGVGLAFAAISLIADVIGFGTTLSEFGIRQQWALLYGVLLTGAGIIMIVRSSSLWSRLYPNHLMTMIVLIVGFVQFLVGERITSNDGLGFDGDGLALIVQNFPTLVFVKGLDTYYLQRTLPLGIIHYTFGVFHISFTNENIIRGFQIYNLALIVLVAHVWGQITDIMKFSVQGKWLAFVGLFVNFAILKFYFYYPVLIDQSAFALGALMLYFFLKSKPWGVLIVSILGAFTWPTMLNLGLLLFIFRQPDTAGLTDYHPMPVKRELIVFIALFICHFGVLAFVNLLFFEGSTAQLDKKDISVVTLPLSIVVSLSSVFFLAKTFFNDNRLFDIKWMLNTLDRKNLSIAAIVLIVVRIAIGYVGVPGGLGDSTVALLNNLLKFSIARPGVFLVSHVVFFGPLVLLALLLWKPFCQLIQQYGPGLTLFFFVSLMFGIANSESRHLINILPFWVVFTVKVSEKLSWRAFHYWLIFITCFLFSKIWLLINVEPLTGNFTDFPWQYYFMNFGPWMSAQMYVAQGSVILMIGILYYFLLPLGRPTKNALEQGPPESVVGSA